MFDYQAGEKYKMTLITVGLSGVMAGAALTLFLSPQGSGPSGKPRVRQKADSDPDVTGVARPVGGRYLNQGQTPTPPPPSPADMVEPNAATELVKGFLPLAWDFSSATAANSQASAMNLMTPECAQNYKSSVWTDEVASGILGSGIKSNFNQQMVSAGQNLQDGSIEVTVHGSLDMTLPGNPPTSKPCKYIYLVKKFGGPLKIAGISEAPN